MIAMSHAEALHTLAPAAGATDALVVFAHALTFESLDAEVRHYARRHLLATVGVMIAGAPGDVATRAEAVVPAVLSVGYESGASGKALIEAIVAGYEIPIAIARACHPDLRQRGFHPTGACAVFGAAVAVAKLRGLTRQQMADAMGIAASSSAGLFAFVNGGADIKRLHAGHASREGLQA